MTLIANLFGHDIKRYHGPDLLFDLEQEGLLKNAVIIGGDAQNKSLVDNKVVSHWVQLPYSNSISVLSEQASRELNPMINEIRIILVSLGLPKQEMVTGRLADGLKGSSILFLPVGAAIDFRTGVAKRSSTVWRSLGLEWLPRLFREPRMLRRNINSLIGAIFFFFHLAFTAAKR